MPTDSNPTTLVRAAETLDYEPTSAPQDAAAARTSARNATDKDDLVQLLAMLALPDSEDDLVALLPLIPAPAPEPDATAPDPIGEILMSADAHLAVATSMYRDGYPVHDITEATGVSAAELAAALAPAGHTGQGPARAVVDVPVTLRPTPVDLSDLDRPVPAMDPAVCHERALTMYYGATEYTDAQISEATGMTPDQIRVLINGYEADFDRAASRTAAADRLSGPAPIAAAPALVAGLPVEELLAWGEQHTAKGVQALAARARTALVELACRHSADRAVVAAESQVERLRRQLAKAEQQLRDAKAGKTTALPTTAAAVTGSVPDGERLEQPADKETRRRIRDWSRTQGLYPADKGDRGVISQEILRAWAQRSTAAPLAQAS